MSARVVCSSCGSDNETGTRFCHACGAALPARPPPDGEARKVVTILFSDVISSTRLAEQLDAESLRLVMSRYFETMESILEFHGGRVEKFIGDALMCVFGVPRVHEDDALRAVRAAVEMREALGELNDEFDRSPGITISTRTGIHTGEVLAGDPGRAQSFVTGDAVNVAARLEQSAAPGNIVIGDATYRLVRDAVVVEELGALPLKGKDAPVRAWRLLEVIPGAPGWARRLDSPLVGREHELAALRDLFERTVVERSPALVTLMGSAGIGKSRLTSELIAGLGDRCTVVAGRCLPYGQGTTFWPVVTALRDAAQIGERDSPAEARQKLSALLPAGEDAEVIHERLGALLGLAPTMPGIQETFWAVRKVLEALGAEKPLVVVFDDIQWGEATFLDLLEYFADWMRKTPILIVCLARRELLDVRPGWAAGKPNATLVALQPLTQPETDGLVRSLLGRVDVASSALNRIAEVTEGNPLFVEETLRMLIDEGLLRPEDGRWTPSGDIAEIAIPPTIHALLTARLDRLEEDERAVIERASVVGRVFWWSAVAELAPPDLRARLSGCLQALVRKELIRPELSDEGGEDAFRFAHVLIRDAAYEALPKAVRAQLHEQLAGWIELDARGRPGDYEEIVGYHLERAHLLLLELGARAERIASLGRRAARVLAAAGRRAFASGDMPAAVSLMSRASLLLPKEDRERIELLLQLAFALLETGDFARLEDLLPAITKATTASRDSGLKAHALMLALRIRMGTNPEGWAAEAQNEATRAISTFEELEDERGLARAWALLGLVHVMNASFGPAEEAWEQAAAWAHRAGDRRDELESLAWLPLLVWAGPTPVERGIQRCLELSQRSEGDKKATSSALMAQAALQSALGRPSEARELIQRARALLEEVALTVWLAGPLTQFAGWTELLAGDAVRAERELRWGYDKLREIGESSWLSTVAAILAESVYGQGRYDEAEKLTRASQASAGAEDVYSQALSRSVRAKVLARRGEAAEAARLTREAVALADGSDFLHLRWHVRMGEAEALRLLGRLPDARRVAQQAAALAEEKGNLVGIEAGRNLLESLREGRPARRR